MRMSTPEIDSQITRMLRQWSEGDLSAAEKLTPLLYDELRRMAAIHLNRERPGHTLQPTALIHEAYLRLIGQGQPEWSSRSHFYRFSAHLMRQILVDHARTKNAVKRGGGFQKVTLTDANAAAPECAVDLLALNQALDRLAAFDERRARVVELRYFGGMTEEETAESLAISVATVRRDVRLAEAWLSKELGASGA
jgi:RNA polymerase sigma-70 factor (ECF subfamily)